MGKVFHLKGADTFFRQHHRDAIFDAIDDLGINGDQTLLDAIMHRVSGHRCHRPKADGMIQDVEFAFAERPYRCLADRAAQNVEEALVHGELRGCAQAEESPYNNGFWTLRP